MSSETAANSKLELLEEENDRLRKQIKEITSEKNNLIIERQGLQTQCRTAIMKWDEIEKELHRVRNDRDQFKKGLSQAMTDNLKVILYFCIQVIIILHYLAVLEFRARNCEHSETI